MKNNDMDLSPQDVKILDILQNDAGKTTGEVAEAINLSQAPCWRRINRIQEEGYIQKKVAILDREKLGMDVVVFATVNLNTHSIDTLEAFEDAMHGLDEVVECYTMTGLWDYILKIVVRDIRHYETFVRSHLTTLSMIREVHSHIAATEVKYGTQLPLNTQLK